MSVVGWYIHHHGRGHLTRFLAVRPHVDASVVAFSSLPRPESLPPATEWVVLPRDDADEGDGPPSSAAPTAGGALHWAPLGHRGHAERLAAIAARAPVLDAVVVDVSVEVTVLARLMGRRVALFAQPGDREDAPHALGRRLADAIIAPWPASAATGPVASALHHVGGVSRFAARRPAGGRRAGTVLALGGGARDAEWEAMLDAAVASTPGWAWQVAGGDTWLDDPWQALCEAEVVVTAAGQNAIADVAAARARAIVVPRPRPFDEQRRTAELLREHGLAIALEPSETADWPALLERARSLDPRWPSWGIDGAAERAAAIIDRVAAGGAS
ncbi:glycosyltransferase [Agrococcus sp. Marseille-P2731]|uniref:glycosyltransferase n=1 Tax=Agrococcus sp. Marseille-P2731 TaxID=1841862 RepID=UPI0009313687|nr:glycosyltransferase [Agrococcus sp. Marseille-P2731]